MWAAVAAVAGLVGLAGLIRRRYVVIQVSGASMMPTLPDGARVLVRRTVTVRLGDIVVFRNPVDGQVNPLWMVKRVAAGPGDPVPTEVRDRVGDVVVPPGRLVVLGDAARTQDSRHFGYVAIGDLLGRAVRGSRSGGSPGPGPGTAI